MDFSRADFQVMKSKSAVQGGQLFGDGNMIFRKPMLMICAGASTFSHRFSDAVCIQRKILVLILSSVLSAMSTYSQSKDTVGVGTSVSPEQSPVLTVGQIGASRFLYEAYERWSLQTNQSSIEVKVSSDGGKNWSFFDEVVPASPNSFQLPQLMVRNGKLYLVCTGGGVYLVRWNVGAVAGGRLDTWVHSSSVGIPRIIALGNRVLVAFVRTAFMFDTLWVKSSSNEGASFSESAKIITESVSGLSATSDDSFGYLCCSRKTVNSGNIGVQIEVLRTTDGSNWSSIFSSTTSGDKSHPSISASHGFWITSFQVGTSTKYVYSSLTDGSKLENTLSLSSSSPRVAINTFGDIYAIYYKNSSIFFKKTYVANPTSWTSEVQVCKSAISPNTSLEMDIWADTLSGVAFSAFGKKLYLDAFYVPIDYPAKPSVASYGIADVTKTRAHPTANINPQGAGTHYYFEYGLTPDLGSKAPTYDLSTTSNSQLVQTTLTGLSPGTLYYFRVTATNVGGTTIGNTFSFTTIDHFTSSSDPLVPMYMGLLTWIDLNNDARVDLITGGSFSRRYNILHPDSVGVFLFGNSMGQFERIGYNLDPFLILTSLEPCDFNNDGHIDLLVSGYDVKRGGQSTILYVNNGGSLQDSKISLPGFLGRSSWLDYNNDGFQDLVMVGQFDTTAGSRIFENRKGTLVEQPSAIRGMTDVALAACDYDNDGDLDILVSGLTSQGVPMTILYRNDGGSFAESGIVFPAIYQGTAAWADIDLDGKPDLIIAGRTKSSTNAILKILRNDGLTFTEVFSYQYQSTVPSICVGDFNNDGYPDVAIAGISAIGGTGDLVLINNQGTFSATNQNNRPLRIRSAYPCVSAFDQDGDGSLDLGFMGFDLDNRVPLTTSFHNNEETPNSPPSAPATLQALADTNFVTLSWTSSSDDHTPSAGLTYNVRIGTTVGGCDIMSPQALLSGERLLSGPGNVLQARSWKIKNLKKGPYYWSVQSLDNAYAGSAFSAEGTFTIKDRVALPTVPLLASPPDSSKNVQLATTLNWSNVNSATSYNVQVSSNPIFGLKLVDDSSLTGLSKTIGQLILGTTYYWRVRAKNEAGWSPFSSSRQFTTIRTTYAEKLGNGIPVQYSMSQNFPNPFNPTTTINFALPKGSPVSLKVFDLLGQEIATLISRELGGGYYSVRWSAEVPSGTYVYRLQAGEYVETKKMILLR